MDKRTLLAVVLSVIVITIGFTIQSIMYPPVVPEPVVQRTEQDSVTQPVQDSTQQSQQSPQAPIASEIPVNQSGRFQAVGNDPVNFDTIVYTDDSTFRAEIDRRGATLRSFELLQHRDGENPVNMILANGDDLPGLRTVFGGFDGQIMDAVFQQEPTSQPNVFRFSRDFFQEGQESLPFRVTKTYTFHPGEYMFELRVSVQDLSRGIPQINLDNRGYSVLFGPQIGPAFDSSTSSNVRGADFRRFLSFQDTKRTAHNRVNPGVPEKIESRLSWAALDGKYFSFVVIPGNANFTTVFATEPNSLGETANQIALERSVISSSTQEDTYRFYAGPKKETYLGIYNRAGDNNFGIANLKIDELIDSNWLGWLENLLKQGLQLFYFIIPNWGIAIILLTVMVKALFYPLTKKSHESTRKMQALAPKQKELQEKFKDNPQKLNAAVAEMYKKEGVNPLGGCLPILIQFPFFIAMYGLFTNHFDLRGALFIPGWITDLSVPDVVYEFGFAIPLLGWTELHLLPFVYLASQLFYGKVTQQPQAGASGGQQKMMMYMLPAVFFFVLYNVPSGLLVYWIAQNIITMLQQLWVNRHAPKLKA